jgi:hypothetical protein
MAETICSFTTWYNKETLNNSFVSEHEETNVLPLAMEHARRKTMSFL